MIDEDRLRGEADTLRDYLAVCDMECPRCAYSLRGLQSDCCPKCGDVLTLRVGLVEPRVGAMIATIVASAIAIPVSFR